MKMKTGPPFYKERKLSAFQNNIYDKRKYGKISRNMWHEELRNLFSLLVLIGDEAWKDKVDVNSAREIY